MTSEPKTYPDKTSEAYETVAKNLALQESKKAVANLELFQNRLQDNNKIWEHSLATTLERFTKLMNNHEVLLNALQELTKESATQYANEFRSYGDSICNWSLAEVVDVDSWVRTEGSEKPTHEQRVQSQLFTERKVSDCMHQVNVLVHPIHELQHILTDELFYAKRQVEQGKPLNEKTLHKLRVLPTTISGLVEVLGCALTNVGITFERLSLDLEESN